MAREPRAGVFQGFLAETADAATESPAVVERNVREKAKENSLAVWKGMLLEMAGSSRRQVGGAGNTPSYARRALGLQDDPDWKSTWRMVRSRIRRRRGISSTVNYGVAVRGTDATNLDLLDCKIPRIQFLVVA